MLFRSKLFTAALFVLGVPAFLFSQDYQYTVDLVNVKEDKIKVSLDPPAFTSPVATFYFPKMVPGTYNVYDFGRFVSGFEVRDETGNLLQVEHPDDNTWKISDAPRISTITYWVEDTWDWVGEGERVFEPGGSNIEEGKNFFLNNHCFFGYFEGMKNKPFQVTFQKPEGFAGSSALSPVTRTAKEEVYRTPDYFTLADSPMMFCEPDTLSLQVGGGNILFAVYSPDKEITAKEVSEEVEPILKAQAAYLGGKLPVDHYAFIIYLFNGFSFSFSYGALEHNFCSMYYLPESDREGLARTLHDFCAHEFFHIVTPLSIHSEQIHDFDFQNPVMSRHLWLYEGVTEYSAGHVQVKEQLITLEEYLAILEEKITGAGGYNDTVPFTVMSQGALDKYKDEYGNVYQKGALIGMCLDVLLRKYSDGKYGIQNLLQDLSREYGKEKPFPDDQLFDKIQSLTYPEIGAFLRKHVGGGEPLPLGVILDYAGITYATNVKRKEMSLGGAEFYPLETGDVEVAETWDLDPFGKAIGYKEGDVLVTLNGERITEESFISVFLNYFITHDEGDDFILVVKRPKGKPGKKQKFKEVTLKTKYIQVERTYEFILERNQEATPEQTRLLKSWLGDHVTEE